MAQCKDSACNSGDTGDAGSIPRSGGSPGVGTGNPVQYSCLKNFTGREAWQAIVHRVAKNRIQLSARVHARMTSSHFDHICKDLIFIYLFIGLFLTKLFCFIPSFPHFTFHLLFPGSAYFFCLCPYSPFKSLLSESLFGYFLRCLSSFY